MTSYLAIVTILTYNAATCAFLYRSHQERAARRTARAILAQNPHMDEPRLLNLARAATTTHAHRAQTATIIAETLADLASLTGLLTAISIL